MFLNPVIDIVSTVFSNAFALQIFYPLFLLAFVATVPCIFRYIIYKR